MSTPHFPRSRRLPIIRTKGPSPSPGSAAGNRPARCLGFVRCLLVAGLLASLWWQMAAAKEPAKVDLSKSRGLAVLADKDFFEPDYAKSQKEGLEILLQYGMRDTGSGDQFFDKKPMLTAIIKKHGAPDLIVYGPQKYFEKDKDYVMTHYYDRVGLVTSSKQPDLVVFVKVQFFDFSVSNRQREGKTFDFIGSSNDKVYYDQGREIGRHIYRKDQASWVTDGMIPDGVYLCFHDGKKMVETSIQGDGGQFTTYYPAGAVHWITHFQNGHLEGESKRLSEAGKPLEVSNYSRGLLDGEAVKYDETGAVVARQKFDKGNPVAEGKPGLGK